MTRKKQNKKAYILGEIHTIGLVAECIEFCSMVAKIRGDPARRKKIEIYFEVYLNYLSTLDLLLKHYISQIKRIKPEVILYEASPESQKLEKQVQFQLSAKAGDLMRSGEIYNHPPDIADKFIDVVDKFVTYEALKWSNIPTGTDKTWESLGDAWGTFDIQNIVRYGVKWEKEMLRTLANELERGKKKYISPYMRCGAC